MKKVLLGTTALVAAGMLTGQAQAADPVTLSLGGYYRSAIGAIFDDENNALTGEGGVNRHEYFHEQDVEVHFTGETTLDNGLTVGVNIQLEGQTQGADQIDETWAYVSGSWGQLRFGDEDDVAYNFAYIAPYVGLFGPTTPWFAFSNAGNTVGNLIGASTNFEVVGISGDSTKLYYVTPDFNGFQLGVSYAPDGTQDGRSNPNFDGCFGCGPSSANGTTEDIWSIALGYSGEFSGVSIGFSAGYTDAQTENVVIAGVPVPGTGLTDPEAWGIGLNLGSGNWAVGGSYQDFDTDNNTFDYEVWDIGITYKVGAWGIGLGFSQAEADTALAKADQNDVWVLGVDYSMGPGISVSGALSYNDFDNKTAGGTGPDYDALSAMLGMTIDY
ncbi:MAG: porin [Alphaproteobacteria bacterium]